MIMLYARVLVDLQRGLEEPCGKLAVPFPDAVGRTFDRAAALNAAVGVALWPVDLSGLLTLAQKPLYEWGVDLS